MKKDMDKIVLESRQEIELLQNICESFYAFSKAPGEEDEREIAKKLSALLEGMYLSW